MEGLADLLGSLLGGLELVAFSLSVGAVAWGLFVLRPWRPGSGTAGVIVARCVALLSTGTIGLALAQVAHLGVTAWVLATALGQSPFPAFFFTLQAQAGLVRASLAAAVALCVVWLARRPDAGRRWATVTLLVVLLAVSGAWLTHAAGRLDHRSELMLVTALHALGAAVWMGGLAQLCALWHLTRSQPEIGALWPTLLGRFSAVGLGTVALVVATALPLARHYVGSWQGLIGTGYGALVVIKALLLVGALGLAAVSLRATWRWRPRGAPADLHRQVPFYLEVETFVLVVILLVAASLSSQPPAVDVPGEWATGAEVAEVFTPRWPQVVSPSHADVLVAGEAARPLGTEAIPEADYLWSEFNHNVSGLLILLVGILALAAWTRRLAWVRHWPLGFLILGGFVALRSDPHDWPWGSIGFWEASGETFEHRLSMLVAVAIGLIEWRTRTAQEANPCLAYVFPCLAAVGGLLLLIHSHEVFELKSAFLIQVSHTVMGLLAVLVACGRWLELRLPAPAGRLAGLVAIMAMLLIGAIMTFYKEPRL